MYSSLPGVVCVCSAGDCAGEGLIGLSRVWICSVSDWCEGKSSPTEDFRLKLEKLLNMEYLVVLVVAGLIARFWFCA
jgi:hypothetical protein